MKSRIIMALSIVALMPALVVGTSFAVEGQDQTTTEQSDDLQKKKQALSDRLEERKQKAQLTLTFFQEQRLKERCKVAQGLIQKIQGRQNGIETSRNNVHTNLVDRLTKLEAKLAERGIDTTELKTQIVELQTKMDTFKTDFAAYQQIVADLAEMDCEADPVAFRASLEAARIALKTVHDDAKMIRSYLIETIKPTLKTIRAQLISENQQETKPAEGTETGEATQTAPDAEGQ